MNCWLQWIERIFDKNTIHAEGKNRDENRDVVLIFMKRTIACNIEYHQSRINNVDFSECSHMSRCTKTKFVDRNVTTEH